MVSNDKCKKCNKVCIAMHFQQKFENWTSGNNDIDKFIQDSQLAIHSKYDEVSNASEWIPYNRLNNIKYIIKTNKYKANWIDGSISCWNNYNQSWIRENQNIIVELKSLKNITLEFMNKVLLIFLFYKN
jgi:hypothetical protein